MLNNREVFIKRAEKHEELAKELRALASGKYFDNDGNELARVENGKLTFLSKTSKLDIVEFNRFANWLKKMASI